MPHQPSSTVCLHVCHLLACMHMQSQVYYYSRLDARRFGITMPGTVAACHDIAETHALDSSYNYSSPCR